MTETLIESLEGLSGAAEEALESLEKHDYRKEVQKIKEEQLPLNVFPKTIKDIFTGIMRWCIPVAGDEAPLPSRALLNAGNIKTFIENLNLTGEKELAHRFQFIQIEPIQEVADEFTQLGLVKQARMLENVCRFARTIKQGYNAAPFGGSAKDLPPVNYAPVLAPEELSEDEREKALRFKQFCDVFHRDPFTLPQKQALYNALKALITDPSVKKPHLIVMTVILLLRTRRAYNNPIPGSLNSCRENIFQSLGLDTSKCHTYGEDSLKSGSKYTLHKYIPQAEEILKNTFGN